MARSACLHNGILRPPGAQRAYIFQPCRIARHFARIECAMRRNADVRHMPRSKVIGGKDSQVVLLGKGRADGVLFLANERLIWQHAA